jgi:hypothetical protein
LAEVPTTVHHHLRRDYAWYVAFNFGYSNFGNRDNNCAVRLVRGGQ